MPDYRVKARNTSAASENKIHDDAVARRYGFAGGLVPGVTVYAYLTHPLVETLGTAWLDRGTGTVKLLKPILEGEEVRVTGAITARTQTGLTATVRAGTDAYPECAVLEATLPAGLPTPVNVAVYPAAALSAERPPASRKHLEEIEALGTPETLFDEARSATYLESVGDGLALYRGPDARVHPAFYLDQANRSLDRNVLMGPWIHVSSAIRHLGSARVGDRLETRGRVRSLYERKGREYVELDLLILAGERRRPVAHVLHTAIWQLPR